MISNYLKDLFTFESSLVHKALKKALNFPFDSGSSLISLLLKHENNLNKIFLTYSF